MPALKKSNTMLIIVALAAALIVMGLLTNAFGIFPIDINNSTKLEIKSSPVLGNESAPVTIYIFSDFSCPFCSAADGQNQQVMDLLKAKDPNWKAPIPEIIKNYVDTGKVKLVFKYMPGHGAGKTAHEVGYALNEQGLFWKFHDRVFANQADANNLEKMKAIAQSLGADMEKLNAFLNAKKYKPLMNNDIQMAQSNKVSGTPSFIINDKMLEGAQSFAVFQQAIEQELAKTAS